MGLEHLTSQPASTGFPSKSAAYITDGKTTFKDRVTTFWDWYLGVAGRFFDTIEAGRCQDLTTEVGDFMRQTLPHMGWVFGPGENGGHSFTLTGEGQVAKQLLAEYWRSRAVEIPNWTFFGSRQPSSAETVKDIAIEFGGHDRVDVNAFIFKTSVDEESKAIDLVAWHPALARVPPEYHYQVLFLLLDELLGEFGTQTWLGNIELEPIDPHAKWRCLADLPAFIQEVRNYYQWRKEPPLRSYGVYQVSEQTTSRRGDTIVGTTCVPNIIFDLLEHDGAIPDDPYEGLGAELAFVAFDSALLPDGRQSEVRGDMEDALNDALESQWSGRALGGAFGLRESYIDLLLLDGPNSRQIVQETLHRLDMQGRSRIESFL
jgi:hypothetical protein